MFRDGSVTTESTWGETGNLVGGGKSWRDVHAALLSTARTEERIREALQAAARASIPRRDG